MFVSAYMLCLLNYRDAEFTAANCLLSWIISFVLILIWLIVWVDMRVLLINVAAWMLEFMLMQLHKSRKLCRSVLWSWWLVFLHFAQFLICLYLLTGDSLAAWWKICVWDGREGYQAVMNIDVKTTLNIWPPGTNGYYFPDYFVSMLFFLAQIICLCPPAHNFDGALSLLCQFSWQFWNKSTKSPTGLILVSLPSMVGMLQQPLVFYTNMVLQVIYASIFSGCDTLLQFLRLKLLSV